MMECWRPGALGNNEKVKIMPTWLLVLLVLFVVYVLGAAGMAIYLRGSNWKMIAFWPLTLIWMFFGNIQ